MIRNFRGISPSIAPSAYVDPGAHVIGDVVIGDQSSVWPTATLRGDIEPIRVGAQTNIQEGAIVHTDRGFPATIGDRVTVGHAAVVHGCTIEDDSMIGIGAIVLTAAKVGRGAVVAAGAVVPEGMQIPPGTLVMGTPAKPRRAVTPGEKERFRQGAANYAERAGIFKQEAGQQGQQ
jgi:carbonic anhydrase/acetyltransferase-like protein (isoleucine patch superfamily)